MLKENRSTGSFLGDPRCMKKKAHAEAGKKEPLTGPRTLEAIFEDLESSGHSSYYSGIARHIRNPANREQTFRLIRHLIIEQALARQKVEDSAQTVLSVIQWIACTQIAGKTNPYDGVGEWSYRTTFDLYKSVCDAWKLAASMCPSRQERVFLGLIEFKSRAEPWLRAKVETFLGEESPRKRCKWGGDGRSNRHNSVTNEMDTIQEDSE